MSFLPASGSRLVVDGYHISSTVRGWSAPTTTATIDRTAITDTATAFILGQDSSTLSVDAMVADGDWWTTVSGRFTGHALRPITLADQGFTAGNAALLANAYQMSAAFGSQVADGVDSALMFQCSGDSLYGQVLYGSTVTTTTNGSAVDNGAATTNGGVAHLHVTAVDGTTPELDVIIEHSVNGSTSWATLASFTANVSTVSSERVSIALGTAVRRYTRVVLTPSGTSPEFDVTVALARF